jgi:hypothetical protein
MEHSLHLAAKHFIQSIAPRFSRAADTSGANIEEVDEDNEDNDNDLEASDLLGKAIALVKQASCLLFSRFLY